MSSPDVGPSQYGQPQHPKWVLPDNRVCCKCGGDSKQGTLVPLRAKGGFSVIVHKRCSSMGKTNL